MIVVSKYMYMGMDTHFEISILMIGVPDIGLQLTKYDLTKTCTINTLLFILTDNTNHRRGHDQPYDNSSLFIYR